MLINATKSRLVIGRFSILPGEKVPAFQLTGDEAAAVDKFKNSGLLVEKPRTGESAQSRPEAFSAHDAGPDVPQGEEIPAAKKARANRRQEVKTGSLPVSEDVAPPPETPEEQVFHPEGE